MHFSVIIPTCNRHESLSNCLELLALAIQKIGSSKYEVIVTDDGRDNAAKELINKKFPWVKWVEGPKKGPAANRNNGASNAKGEWLIFIDDDCLPTGDLLSAYQLACIRHRDIKVFEGCIKADRVKRSFVEESPVNEVGGHLWSCNFMIEQDLFFETLKGFDINFPYPAMEDVDLNYRLRKQNIIPVFVSEAVVIHPWRKQRNVTSITMKRFKSTLYFLEKHPEKKKDFGVMFYIKAFLLFSRNTVKKSLEYKGRGLFPQLTFTFLHLYFAVYIVFVKR